MRKMISYRMDPIWIDRLEMLSKSLRVSKTSALEYCVDFCISEDGIGSVDSFISYALSRREGSEPEIGNSLSNWLGESNAESHSQGDAAVIK